MGWKARQDDLVVTAAGDELVVYDAQTSHLHTLSPAIVSVWRSCDGVATIEAIALATGMTPQQAQAALKQLHDVGLIDGERLSDAPAQDRRSFLRKVALGTTIVSVTAPMAARAASVSPAGSCWWLSTNGIWTAWDEDYATCQQLDSCYPGGGGESGGGCYKWTVGQNDPPPGW